MTIGEKLNASKNGLDALLAYANSVTGADDTNIGDAVHHLAESSSVGLKFDLISEYTLNESWQSDTKGNPVSIANALIADASADELFYIKAENNQDRSNYRFNWLVVCGLGVPFLSDTMTQSGGLLSRGANAVMYRNFTSGTSAWVASGTVFKVYRMSMN